MSTTIEDGKGTGILAQVDEEHRFLTRSFSSSEESFISFKGGAYFANTADTADSLTVSTTEARVLYLKNDYAGFDMVFQKFFLSTDSDGVIFKILKNDVVTTVGNNNTHVPVNLNFGSSNNASVTCYNWNEVGTGMTGISGATTLSSFILSKGTTTLPPETTFICPKGTAISFSFKSPTGTAEISLGVRLYFVKE